MKYTYTYQIRKISPTEPPPAMPYLRDLLARFGTFIICQGRTYFGSATPVVFDCSMEIEDPRTMNMLIMRCLRDDPHFNLESIN